MRFTRDNVRIIIDAPKDITKELAQKVDNLVLNSPTWSPGDTIPKFIGLEQLKKSFLRKKP